MVLPRSRPASSCKIYDRVSTQEMLLLKSCATGRMLLSRWERLQFSLKSMRKTHVYKAIMTFRERVKAREEVIFERDEVHGQIRALCKQEFGDAMNEAHAELRKRKHMDKKVIRKALGKAESAFSMSNRAIPNSLLPSFLPQKCIGLQKKWVQKVFRVKRPKTWEIRPMRLPRSLEGVRCAIAELGTNTIVGEVTFARGSAKKMTAEEYKVSTNKHQTTPSDLKGLNYSFSKGIFHWEMTRPLKYEVPLPMGKVLQQGINNLVIKGWQDDYRPASKED